MKLTLMTRIRERIELGIKTSSKTVITKSKQINLMYKVTTLKFELFIVYSVTWENGHYRLDFLI